MGFQSAGPVSPMPGQGHSTFGQHDGDGVVPSCPAAEEQEPADYRGAACPRWEADGFGSSPDQASPVRRNPVAETTGMSSLVTMDTKTGQ